MRNGEIELVEAAREVRKRMMVMRFKDRGWVLLWILENQLGRRNLLDDQRADIAADVIDWRVKLNISEQRKNAALTLGRKRRGERGVQGGPPAQPVERSNVVMARKTRLSVRKIRTARKIRKADSKLADRIRKSELP